ncbi:tumor necrosis factor receptor superfamily member 1A isoform X1 [Xyrichtys novacula]|uniref:Tumor necrosis factor receptor superfamily member 1A isoform X1 n=1 Tax=Xyrichtys novacula TaxID=13765 RepID=A0AAV1FMQ7_XYRNO|nr:tumor necrosis factor receptor superfamily member 1A isoform X1 [Xyrichtys novacula]
MERGVPGGRWSQKVPVGTVLLLMCIPTLAMLQPAQERKCPDWEYLSEKGFCCNKCPKGFKLLEECSGPNQRSNCTPCPAPFQYSDHMNHFPTCKSCKRCSRSGHEIEITPCKRDQNTICRCVEGYYRSYIDSQTYDCIKCSQCGSNERVKQTCSPENNTVCECAENYHRVKHKCEPCKECTTGCNHLCLSPVVSTTAPGSGEKYLMDIIGVAAGALVMCGVIVVITHIATKWSTRKQLLRSSSGTSDNSQESCERDLIYKEQHSHICVEAVPECPQGESDPEPSNPLDRPRLEIKIHDLIYTVLDLVSVQQMKQLMRSLGVRDTDIERAELDYRGSREAHYQILRMWAERGSTGGRCGILQESLLQELLDKLREMYLGRAAEELETKYGIQ